MGPEPIIRTDWMELSLGIFFLSDRFDQVNKNDFFEDCGAKIG